MLWSEQDVLKVSIPRSSSEGTQPLLAPAPSLCPSPSPTLHHLQVTVPSLGLRQQHTEEQDE